MSNTIYHGAIALTLVLIIIYFMYENSPPVIAKGKIITHVYKGITHCGGKNVVHLLWTGGYDSTARLMQLLIIEKHPVQPIYVAAPNTDTKGIFAGRKNIVKEINTMKKIKKAVLARYPHTEPYFLPTVYIIKANYTDEIKQSLTSLHNKGYFERSHNQYGSFAAVSKYFNMTLEQGCERGEHTRLGKAVQDYVVIDESKKGNDGQLLPNWQLSDIAPEDIKIFNQLRFPLIKMTKEDMLNQAKKYGYDDIMCMTTSCWYPSLLGKKCNDCDMCNERIFN